jgi:dinuclear metal center YbgI/SA1388 family protein
MTQTQEIADYLDAALDTAGTPDYPGALNGLQLTNDGTVSKVAACVDFSMRAVSLAVDEGVDLLIVHHGMFWGGAKPFVGPVYSRIKTSMDNNIAVYSSHLPLDRHPTLGNNVLLSRELGLEPSGDFAQFKNISIGVSGTTDLTTADLVERARHFSRTHGGDVIVTPFDEGRATKRWALCTGAGASSESLQEAAEKGIDTLITGEGPHHTAVEAAERGMVIIYAGHYATETLGVSALAQHVSQRFGIEWTIIHAPTGL